jgi:acetylornithine deacetylase/succinyl-diaminopimelate desuccinylase-like protein
LNSFPRIGGAVQLDPVATLQQLIQTPSVNPLGSAVAGPDCGERRMTERLMAICRQQGWPYYRQPVHEDRDNLLIFVEGSPLPGDGGELLLWDVHQDTVAVEGMTIDPFAGEVRAGRVYGRGACDVKGSMAAMLAALSRLGHSIEPSPNPSQKRSGPMGRRPTVVLACTVNEECGFTGAKALARLFAGSQTATGGEISGGEAELIRRFLPRAPDAAIVAEPTQFDVVVAHQGQVRWHCHTVGRAAHSSHPDAGENAIYAMAQVVQTIERYHAELSHGVPHALCGRPSVCVSTIRGGAAINTVPDRVTIGIDRRIAPSDTPAAAYGELVRYIAENTELGRCQLEHDPPLMQSTGLSDAHNRETGERLAAKVRAHGRAGELVGVRYGTDAAAISVAGVPTVVFGPGSIEKAHTADEFIEIDELNLATQILHHIARDGLQACSGHLNLDARPATPD